MDPSPSPSPAVAGLRASPTVIVAEPAWRRAIPGVVALAGRAAQAASVGAAAAETSRATPRETRGDIPADIIVVLTTDRAVRRLNARDRGRDKPTNVLTYPPPAPGLPGEIILALGQIRREAAAAAGAPHRPPPPPDHPPPPRPQRKTPPPPPPRRGGGGRGRPAGPRTTS